MKLDFPISLSVQVDDKHAVLCFCYLELRIKLSVVTKNLTHSGEPPTGLDSISCLYKIASC